MRFMTHRLMEHESRDSHSLDFPFHFYACMKCEIFDPRMDCCDLIKVGCWRNCLEIFMLARSDLPQSTSPDYPISLLSPTRNALMHDSVVLDV